MERRHEFRSLWVRCVVSVGLCALSATYTRCEGQGLTGTGDTSERPQVDYERQVKPLLQSRCYACHGALKQQANLRLDTVALMLQGGDSGPVLVRGDSANSHLLQRVAATDVNQRMPPEHEGEPLSAVQVALLRDWIADGASAPDDEQPEPDLREHWAFRPCVRPDVPVRGGSSWGRNEIDALIAVRHQELGLVPQPEAPRELLVRRLYLDLIGVPPSPAEWAAIDVDPSSNWYAELVERLLADPRYGERWARHWMDVWRYSDWWGLGDQLRNSQKHMWHWRDWIIESLNRDTPYDEMVRLMLAADELYPNDLDRLRATGYLARNYFLFNRNQWMDETVEHVSKGFLGLTMNCAKCHDHKYDPIEQPDYYRMRAFFEPYHVRLDMLPGELDLNRDGLPRAFDRMLSAPTYIFRRGQETQPDTSTVIAPDVPEFLRIGPLSIQPVSLPVESWQPERRVWVLEARRAAVRQKLQAAEAAAASAREQLAERQREAAAGDVPPPVAAEATATVSVDPLAVARRECQVAECALAVARAEVVFDERREAAMRAAWALDDTDPSLARGPLEAAKMEAARAAAHAESEVALAVTALGVAECELCLQHAAAETREAVEKELATARAAQEKATEQLDHPSEQFTSLVGAVWTPTRFISSTQDDPQLEFPAESSGRRTALAAWITDPRNPLTARVAVNHIWLRHLGTPLVPTVFDFGRKGIPPANPALLDWLAAELMEQGWSMKHLHRLIVHSATYRMDSTLVGAETNLAKDPDNRHAWRRSPVRLESQIVRDSILALAGTLDPTRGGPPVLPTDQAQSLRRSLYFFHSNNERNLFLTTFDEALVKDCYRREQSIVPQQALALANSGLVLDAAAKIAQQLVPARDSDAAAIDDATFIRQAFTVVLGIKVSDAEVLASSQALAAWRQLEGSSAEQARTNLVWALMNHNDFVTLR